MAKPLIQFLSETSGACCQWFFLSQPAYRGKTNKELAAILGVSERTVSEARSMLNNGAFACRRKKDCQKEKLK